MKRRRKYNSIPLKKPPFWRRAKQKDRSTDGAEDVAERAVQSFRRKRDKKMEAAAIK